MCTYQHRIFIMELKSLLNFDVKLMESLNLGYLFTYWLIKTCYSELNPAWLVYEVIYKITFFIKPTWYERKSILKDLLDRFISCQMLLSSYNVLCKDSQHSLLNQIITGYLTGYSRAIMMQCCTMSKFSINRARFHSRFRKVKTSRISHLHYETLV